MTLKLSDADGRAVDLFLDVDPNHTKSGSSTANAPTFVAPADTDFHQRLGKVEVLLNAIGQMPAPEIPVDLVTRTIARIERNYGAPMGESRSIPQERTEPAH